MFLNSLELPRMPQPDHFGALYILLKRHFPVKLDLGKTLVRLSINDNAVSYISNWHGATVAHL
jgi:hypothetical protein